MARAGRGGETESRGSLSPTAVLWGLVAAFGLAIGVGVAMGLTAALSPWDATPGLLRVGAYGSVGLAGFYAARRAPRLGWLHGGLVGLLFLVIGGLALVPGFRLTELLSLAGLVRSAAAFGAGAVGGMVARLG